MRWSKFLRFSLLFLVVMSVPFAKQFRQGSTGRIEGVVFDQIGMPIEQARVQACNTMSGDCSSTFSELSGFYRLDRLPPGRYSLWAEAKMHNSEWIPMVIVEEGQVTRYDIQLRREIPTMTARPSSVQ